MRTLNTHKWLGNDYRDYCGISCVLASAEGRTNGREPFKNRGGI